MASKKGQTKIETVIIVMLVVANILSAGSIYYSFSLSGKVDDISETVGALSLSEASVVTVGSIYPFTGTRPHYGAAAQKGGLIAIKNINDAGGIKDSNGVYHAAEIVWEDNAADASKALSSYRKLVDVNQVKAIVGGTMSSMMLPYAPLAEDDGVILMGTHTSSAQFTDYKKFFRTQISGAVKIKIYAEYAYELGARTLVSVYSTDDWGRDANTAVVEGFTGKGGEVLGEVGVAMGETDFSTVLTQIRDLDPDAVFTNVHETESIFLYKAAYEWALSYPTITWHCHLKSDYFKDSYPETVENVYSYIPAIDTTAPLYLTYREQYIEMFGETGVDDTRTVLAHDGFMAIFKAIEATMDANGEYTFEGLVQALYGLEFDGASGHVDFDLNGDVTTARFSAWLIENGEWKFHTIIER